MRTRQVQTHFTNGGNLDCSWSAVTGFLIVVVDVDVGVARRKFFNVFATHVHELILTKVPN